MSGLGNYVACYGDLYDHPKTMRLGSALAAIGYPEIGAVDRALIEWQKLALWSMSSADGRVDELTPTQFAKIVGWFDLRKAKGHWEAWLASGFLDVMDDGRVFIHDWQRIAGHVKKKQKENTRKQREYWARIEAERLAAEPTTERSDDQNSPRRKPGENAEISAENPRHPRASSIHLEPNYTPPLIPPPQGVSVSESVRAGGVEPMSAAAVLAAGGLLGGDCPPGDVQDESLARMERMLVLWNRHRTEPGRAPGIRYGVEALTEKHVAGFTAVLTATEGDEILAGEVLMLFNRSGDQDLTSRRHPVSFLAARASGLVGDAHQRRARIEQRQQEVAENERLLKERAALAPVVRPHRWAPPGSDRSEQQA